MKLRKKMRVLSGVTAVRVALGLTQLALAESLGVSKSLISMVENDKRKLPVKALARLVEMEKAVAFNRQQSRKLLLDESAAEIKKKQVTHQLRCLDLGLLQYRLKKMRATYVENYSILADLAAYMESSESSGSKRGKFAGFMLRQQYKITCVRIKRNDLQQQAKLQGRIAMLEIMIAAYTEPVLYDINAVEPANITAAPAAINESATQPYYLGNALLQATQALLLQLPVDIKERPVDKTLHPNDRTINEVPGYRRPVVCAA